MNEKIKKKRVNKPKYYNIEDIKFIDLPTHKRFKNLNGSVFNKLKVLGYAGMFVGCAHWYCECECGNITRNPAYTLQGNTTTSCGCFWRERFQKSKITHGQSIDKKSFTYSTWVAMHGRCNNPKNSRYSSYGGRGIKVCNEWLKFENFLEDMGERPEGLSIDRINVNGNYCKENCRWATVFEQMNNRQNTLLIEYNNKIQSLKEWSIELNISYATLYARIQTYKLPVEKAFTKKIQHAT